MTAFSYLTLSDGMQIPQMGFGVWQIPDDPVPMGQAIKAGYRLIDTAPAYGNERSVGLAIRQCGLSRDEMFVTTKLNNPDHGYDQALRGCDASLEKLGLDHLDLYLIHWPKPTVGLYVDSWRAFIRLRDEGRVRSIGVSNFGIGHIQRLIDETGVVPFVNQVELHPRFQQRPLRGFARSHGIVIQSWSPLGRGHMAENRLVKEIASRYNRSWAQIILRWHIQSGLAVIPRSVSPERMRENLDVFDFTLSEADMLALDSMDMPDGRIGFDPELF